MIRYIKLLRPRLLEHHILLSLLIYSFGDFFYTSISTTLGNLVQLIGALYYIKIVLCANKSITIPTIQKICLTFLSIWTLVLVFRTFFFDTNIIISLPLKDAVMNFFLGERIWPIFLVFIPYVLGYRYNIDMSYFCRIGFFLAIIFLILYPFAYYSMVNFQFTMYGEDGENYQDFISSSTMGITSFCPCLILLFWKKYIPTKIWYITLIACIANLLMTMYMARRGDTVITIIYFILIWYLYTTQSKKNNKFKMVIIAVVLIFMCYNIFTNLSDSFFSLLIERSNVDTRSGVENNFYKDFSSDFDWLFGRGLLGTYFDNIFGEQRFSIETGYLFIILRCGLLYLIPYVILLLLSGIKGYIRSKNIFVKSIAIFMLMSVLELYPWGYQTFTFKFYIIWLGVYICNSKYFLNMSDNDIQETLFAKSIIK